MMRIGLVPNITKDENLEATKELINFITEEGHSAIVDEFTAKFLNMPCAGKKDVYAESDCLIALGGDGTMLNTAEHAVRWGLPIMGINMGRLGYLTDVDMADFKKALSAFFRGEYKTEKRMMLLAEIYEGNELLCSKTSLNDVCVKGDEFKMVNLHLEINGTFFENYLADGVIFSTPTGSTAYNLSAKGPILKPDSEMVAITPICPHSLYACSIVLPATDKISVSCKENAVLSCDGNIIFNLKSKHVLTIQRYKYYTSIIKTNSLGFYDILRHKMIGKG